MGGSILTAAGSLIGAEIQSGAISSAANAQQQALSKELSNVNTGMDVGTVQNVAQQAGQQQAEQQLALQRIIDPGLAAARQASGQAISTDVNNINNPNSPSNQIAQAAVQNATTGSTGLDTGKAALISAALGQLQAGATLPPDVEASLVQAGLEQAGTGTNSAPGGASGTGYGGNILRTVLGTAGLNLQMQRQQQASNLLGQAGALQQQKQGALAELFPSLAQTQLANLQGTTNALTTSNNLVPTTGLSSSAATNLWLSRIGAQNQLYGGQGNVTASQALGQGQVWSQGIGAATSSLGGALGGGGNGGGAGGLFSSIM